MNINQINKIKKSPIFKITVCVLLLISATIFANAESSAQINDSLGVVDANTGLEAGHIGLNGKYSDWFQANYAQTQNLGIHWNRWAVEWTKVESSADPTQPPDYNWLCVWNEDDDSDAPPKACPEAGDRFDYIRLAQEDKSRGIESLIVLTEIPASYQTSPDGRRIIGLSLGIFNLIPTGTTNDPGNPNINNDDPININNRWASYFHEVIITLGGAGVHHWQIMNEMNLSETWSSEEGIVDYVRVIEVADKILQYRQRLGEAVEDRIIVGGLIYMSPDHNPKAFDWVLLMYQQLAIRMADESVTPFNIDAIALHTYDRNKTSYDYPIAIYEQLEELDNLYQVNLSTKPLWLTETGSNSCATEFIIDICPPVAHGEPRTTDKEQSYYIVQSFAYAQSLPAAMERYFQFHLHEGCPHGISGQNPGYGLLHNWEFYANAFIGGGNNGCSIRPHDGSEKPAYQAMAQTSRWLRDFIGYSSPMGNDVSAEFLAFPLNGSQYTFIAWSRKDANINFTFYNPSGLSGGPILVVAPDGMTQVVSQNGSGGYNLTLPRATNPIIGNDEFAMVGGQPFIILEHLLFDLGAKPAVFDPTGGIAALQFGLNLPAGIITQDIVSITIYDEVDNIVWANSGLFSNGEHRWEWDGRNGQSGEPVPNGLYHYEISLPNQGNYIITGVVGVSQPGVLACFFNATPPQPPDYYPPSPNQAFVDYRGSETYDEIDFYWPTSPPIPELEDNDNWLARYVGYLEVETAGMYQFRLGDTDDVARLFVNGALILMPDWITLTSDEPLDLYSPDVYLSEGLHTIVIEHAQIEGSASLQLLWRQAAPRSLWLSVDTLWLPGDALTDVCEQVRVDIGAFRNGDFEDGLNDWIGEPASHQWELTTEAHNGDYAAFGSSHTHLGPSSLRSAPFRVAENSCYTVSLFLQENYPSHHITFFFKTNLV